MYSPYGPEPGGYDYPPPRPKNTAAKVIAAVGALVFLIVLGVWLWLASSVGKNGGAVTGESSSVSVRPEITAAVPAPVPAPPSAPSSTYIIKGGDGWEIEAGCLATGQPPEVCAQRRADAAG